MQCRKLPNSNDECSIIYGGKGNNMPSPTGSAPDAIPGMFACSCKIEKKREHKSELILKNTSK